MKKQILIAIAVLFAVAFTACTDTPTSIVEFPDGKRVAVENSMYAVGDTVCVVHAFTTGAFGDYTGISEAYWCDTTTATVWGDSSVTYSSYKMGVIIPNP